mmetsp:Transcript_45687/g.129009  ORF Transcript_45687/g.129009 Transcript_45687/m.129009 type:complete len:291 (+) Transcript_45687:1006-1878(+)
MSRAWTHITHRTRLTDSSVGHRKCRPDWQADPLLPTLLEEDARPAHLTPLICQHPHLALPGHQPALPVVAHHQLLLSQDVLKPFVMVLHRHLPHLLAAERHATRHHRHHVLGPLPLQVVDGQVGGSRAQLLQSLHDDGGGAAGPFIGSVEEDRQQGLGEGLAAHALHPPLPKVLEGAVVIAPAIAHSKAGSVERQQGDEHKVGQHLCCTLSGRNGNLMLSLDESHARRPCPEDEAGLLLLHHRQPTPIAPAVQEGEDVPRVELRSDGPVSRAHRQLLVAAARGVTPTPSR